MGDFIIEKDLHLVNHQDSPPTFTPANGNSWIDLTLSTHKLIQKINNWEVLDEITASDHNYINIDIFKSISKTVKKLTKKGEIGLIESTRADRTLSKINGKHINNKENLEQIINETPKRLEQMYKKHSKKIKESTGQNPWWTPELDTERKRVRAHRRHQKCQNQLKENYKSLYVEAQKTYKNNTK